MYRAREFSSGQEVNNSSNWSTTTTKVFSPSAPRTAAAHAPGPRRSLASSTGYPMAAATALTSAVAGSAPGLTTSAGQRAEPGSAPSPRRASRPALSSELLPAPDGATTIRGPPVRHRASSLRTRSAVDASRPENQLAWSGSNAWIPG